MPDEGKNFGGSLVLDFRKWRHVKTIYNLAQLPAQLSKFWFSRISQFFFLYPLSKDTNLEVRHLIQVTKSLIFINLAISIFCAV